MAALTLVLGEEELLVSRAVTAAVAAATGNAAVSDTGLGAAVSDVAAAELTPDALRELTSPSLFDEDRIVVVRGLIDATKDVVAALVGLAQAPADDGCSVIVVHAGARAKSTVDALRGAGAEVVTVPSVTTVRDREQFVVDEVGRAGGTIERAAAADLVAAVGSDLRELAVTSEQLIADIGSTLSVEDVASYHRGRAESTGFAVADRAVEGDVPAAVETLRWALATGTDPVLVNAALANNLRTIGVVGAAGRRSPDALAGVLRMPAWRIRRAQGWLRGWRPESLRAAVRAVVTADAGIKGADDDAAFAVERAVLAVATAAAGARGPA